MKTPPAGLQIATYTNKDRDAINASIFEMWSHANRPANDSTLKSACTIFMDDLYMNDGLRTATPITLSDISTRTTVLKVSATLARTEDEGSILY